MPQAVTADRVALYRLFGADNALLYIGISRNPTTRFASHATYKSWWGQVTRKEVTWLKASWREALDVEAKTIRKENPLHNGKHNEPRVPFKPRTWPTIEIGYGKAAVLADLVRKEIRSGRWAPGCKVPKRRDLAAASHVGEGTADLAYRRLQAEGLLQFRPGHGTFVVGP